jgi:SlyX protein
VKDEQRLVDLELKFMHQDRLLEELSSVLAAQQKELTRLGSEVAVLRERLRAAESAVPNEPPPHY